MTKEREKKMFSASDRSPRHPVLPLKRHKDGKNKPELGFVLSKDVKKIYFGNMYNPDFEKLDNKVYSLLSILSAC
ncbi:MAG: hypothetical protein ACXU9X_14035 [Thermodesulfobacteriota bacterium]